MAILIDWEKLIREKRVVLVKPKFLVNLETINEGSCLVSGIGVNLSWAS